MSGEDLDGQLLDNICWNSSGKLLAGSMDNMVNIWGVGGKSYLNKVNRYTWWIFAIFTRKTTFMSSCLLFCTPSPF